MKEELLKNIESSASELRVAKARVMQKSQEIEAQRGAISSLEESLKLAHKQHLFLCNESMELAQKEIQASSRYNFYTAEAVNHPY